MSISDKKPRGTILYELGNNVGLRQRLIDGPYRSPRLKSVLFTDFMAAVETMDATRQTDLIASACPPLKHGLREDLPLQDRAENIWGTLTDMSAKQQQTLQHLHTTRLAPGSYGEGDPETPEEKIARLVTVEAAHLPMAFNNIVRILARAPLRKSSASILSATDMPLLYRQYAQPIVDSSRIMVIDLGLDFNRAVDLQRQKLEAHKVVGSSYFRPLDDKLWPAPRQSQV